MYLEGTRSLESLFGTKSSTSDLLHFAVVELSRNTPGIQINPVIGMCSPVY